ncbi:GNAT family N-acetyltransferase [Streptomyces sp. NPDC050560]|uniref:GNAT family N-acetyltransferase n=1 Tax=Streptomyces sp. NPDC050560 TaxID=3365630 RepID=UPI00378A517D
MTTALRRLTPADTDALTAFLTAESWPYHGSHRPDPGLVRRRAAQGYYAGPGAETFWITADGTDVGMARLFDLDDGGTPMFDLRVAAGHRGRGIGTAALAHLTRHVFTAYPAVHRFEGTTRADNTPMCRTFLRAGWVKEAHYREGWPDEDGTRHDAVGYAILDHDWRDGTVTLPRWDAAPMPGPGLP